MFSGVTGKIAASMMVMMMLGVVRSAESPYGICAHVSRGELEIAPQEFERMKEIGIRWVRTDFDWNGVNPVPGKWNFNRLDQLLRLAEDDGMNILPILDYDVAWARPAYRHLDAWGEYVSRTVRRYGDRLRTWEVYNEPNLQVFWRDKPSGANYTALLKRAYEEIKKVSPELVVLYGGTSGVPLDYIEESFAAGAGNYFDVMNIHPYHWQGTPERMIEQIRNLKQLMKKYNINKPIWITEVGWSTAQPPKLYREILPAAFVRAGIDPSRSTISVVDDPGRKFTGTRKFNPEYNLGIFRNVERIRLDQLKDLDPARSPALMPAIGEEFPGEYIPDLLAYVRKGGTLLLPSGLPFYYDLRRNGDSYRRVQVNEKYMPMFHLGWEAWWTDNRVPQKESYQKPAPEFSGKFQVDFRPSSRFLHDRNLKPGDQFIPLVEAGTDSYKGVVAALYKLNSDLKGNIIVCTMLSICETVSEQRQAEMLPRTYLIALAYGIPRIFWYNFRSDERAPDQREGHFGIVRKNQLEPKASFHAYRTLAGFCPAGSSRPSLSLKQGVFCAFWTRPDGKKVWALWTEQQPREVKLSLRGEATEIADHLGRRISLPRAIPAAPVYLVGPEEVAIDSPER